MTAMEVTGTSGAESPPGKCHVCVVGAGPAGLMLAAVLARFGISVQVHDDRADQTTAGRADGLQPKTIETLRMLRLGGELLDTGVKVFDICMWRAERATGGQPAHLRRVGREVHYPRGAVDLLHPFILLCHQGMVEGMFVEDLRGSGVEVRRGSEFDAFRYEAPPGQKGPLWASFKRGDGTEAEVQADYLVGCDGARSRVRQGIPGAHAQGNPHDSYWAVLDGELDTDFPDIWSKTVVYSEEHGSVLIIPRERNLTRFYIEVRSQEQSVDERFVVDQARKVMAPYRVDWLSVEWFGNYRVAQRVAAGFSDATRGDGDDDDDNGGARACRPPRVFIAGDAAHTHSPKAAQGMNTSMHDSWNLGWKLNLAARGLARRGVLLGTYESERRKVARDLIDFDYEHANSIAGGDAQALAENFRTNVGFISGVGAEYGENPLNVASGSPGRSLPDGHMMPPPACSGAGTARPGRNLPPAKVTRYIDDNPVDIQLDIPVLGQFRILVVAPDVLEASAFLDGLSEAVLSPSSFIMRLSAAAGESYKQVPRPARARDSYYRPERYTSLSDLFTFGLITSTDKDKFELASLPLLLRRSRWTVYLDNVPNLDTQGLGCTDKWLGGLSSRQAAIVNVRPDGYVGSIMEFSTAEESAGREAALCLDEYYGGFLQAPSK